jgi:hypothetical protein
VRRDRRKDLLGAIATRVDHRRQAVLEAGMEVPLVAVPADQTGGVEPS